MQRINLVYFCVALLLLANEAAPQKFLEFGFNKFVSFGNAQAQRPAAPTAEAAAETQQKVDVNFGAGGGGGNGQGGGGVAANAGGATFTAGGGGAHGQGGGGGVNFGLGPIRFNAGGGGPGSGWYGTGDKNGGGGVQFGIGGLKFGAGGGGGGGGVVVSSPGGTEYKIGMGNGFGNGKFGFHVAKPEQKPAVVGNKDGGSIAEAGVVGGNTGGSIVPSTDAVFSSSTEAIQPISSSFAPSPTTITDTSHSPNDGDEPKITVDGNGIRVESGSSVSMISSKGWNGENVCIDRQADIIGIVDVRNSDTSSPGTEFSCDGDDESYICRISVRHNAETKSETVVYQCCPGYVRSNGQCIVKPDVRTM